MFEQFIFTMKIQTISFPFTLLNLFFSWLQYLFLYWFCNINSLSTSSSLYLIFSLDVSANVSAILISFAMFPSSFMSCKDILISVAINWLILSWVSGSSGSPQTPKLLQSLYQSHHLFTWRSSTNRIQDIVLVYRCLLELSQTNLSTSLSTSIICLRDRCSSLLSFFTCITLILDIPGSVVVVYFHPIPKRTTRKLLGNHVKCRTVIEGRFLTLSFQMIVHLSLCCVQSSFWKASVCLPQLYSSSELWQL